MIDSLIEIGRSSSVSDMSDIEEGEIDYDDALPDELTTPLQAGNDSITWRQQMVRTNIYIIKGRLKLRTLTGTLGQ